LKYQDGVSTPLVKFPDAY